MKGTPRSPNSGATTSSHTLLFSSVADFQKFQPYSWSNSTGRGSNFKNLVWRIAAMVCPTNNKRIIIVGSTCVAAVPGCVCPRLQLLPTGRYILQYKAPPASAIAHPACGTTRRRCFKSCMVRCYESCMSPSSASPRLGDKQDREQPALVTGATLRNQPQQLLLRRRCLPLPTPQPAICDGQCRPVPLLTAYEWLGTRHITPTSNTTGTHHLMDRLREAITSAH